MAAIFATAATGASAQVAAPVAAQQLAPTREEIDRRPQQQAPRAGKLTIDGGIQRAPCALDAPAYANIRVTITEARFNNLQGVSPEELKTAYAQLLGPDKPISTLCTIRDAAATMLREKGYLAAVQVPVQKIENGVVTFDTLFAKIVAIRVRGNAGKSEKLLAAYLSHLTEEKIFNRFAAERYLLLARDLPGYDVRMSLKPSGGAPGELVGEISVVHTPIDVSASLQNFSSHSTGRWTGAIAAQAYGLLGGDRLTASVSSTADVKEQQIVQLGYDTRLGGEGLTIGGNITYAWTEPDIRASVVPGTSSKLIARTLFATGEVSYPIIRSQRFSLLGAVGMDYIDQKVDFAGVALTRDHLRVGYLRFDMDASDIAERRVPRWRASGTVEFRQGYDIFGATAKNRPVTAIGPSRPDGDPTSSLVRASATLELNLGKGWWIAAMPRAQYAFTRLFSFEEFSAGNYSIGRGYDPGVITGDSGIGSAYELRLPRFAPFPKANLSLQPFTFTDIAWAWDKGAGPANPDFVASVGGGVRAMLDNRFRLDGTIAVPLKAAGLQARRHDPRFLIVFTTKLWPWSAQ